MRRQQDKSQEARVFAVSHLRRDPRHPREITKGSDVKTRLPISDAMYGEERLGHEPVRARTKDG